ncbi:MAG: ArsA-related P-loop ATPase, partial [Bdellovibrio sp.]
MEIHFVTGKGGVGKTTVAGLLGLGFAAQGKATLVAELGESSALQILWDLPEISYSPRRIQRGLNLSRWSGSECLREYLQHLIKLESLTSLFFDNKVTRSLVNVAPALHELAILGKATSGPPRNVGP